MIDSIKISYHNNGIVTTMELVDDYSDNLPYELAEMFIRVIDDTNANPDIVIRELLNEYEHQDKD